MQLRQQVARDAARAAMPEDLHHARLRDLLHDHGIQLGTIRDNADVRAVALVAGAPVSHAIQGKLHGTSSNFARMASRGTKHESVSSLARTEVRTPPPPAGPHV